MPIALPPPVPARPHAGRNRGLPVEPTSARRADGSYAADDQPRRTTGSTSDQTGEAPATWQAPYPRPGETWTGLHAAALQKALRATNEEFAEALGVSTRAVANWNARPALMPRAETQQILDTALSRAHDDVKQRFAQLVKPGDTDREARQSEPAVAATQPGAQPLRVVIAVVRAGGRVLMVRPRNGGPITWQFPTGIVKPGANASVVAVTETLAETGVVCDVRRSLGSRVHPITGAFCDYYLCDYLSGDAVNLDPVENAAVTWLDCDRASSVIPNGQLFPPVEEMLRAAATDDDPAPAGRPPIAAAIVIDGDEVLLVRRRVAEGSLSWQFPAGAAEPGELPTDAAVRETREEVGLAVEPSAVLGRRMHPVSGREMIYVACQPRNGTATIVDTDELDDLMWCPRDQVEEHLSAGIYPPVLSYLRGQPNR